MDDEEIFLRCRDLKQLMKDAKQNFDDIMNEYQEQLGAVQKLCKHTKTRFWPDVSGNNGSWYQCLNCGKEPI